MALGVDAAPNLLSATVSACGGGVLHIPDHRKGVGWVVEAVADLLKRHNVMAVGLDPSGPAGALVPDFEKAKIEVVLLDSRESVQACGAFLAAVTEEDVSKRLVHRDEYALNAAVAGAKRRNIGDAWKWSRRDSMVDISPLVAATVARYLWHRGVAEKLGGPLFAY